MPFDENNIASFIDHTLLKPNASLRQIEQLCAEARQHGFASVCVNPVHVRACAEMLGSGTIPKVCTVIGFPLGASASSVKSYETKIAIEDGAEEIDMVINIGALKDGNVDLVKADIQGVVKTAHAGSAIVKVIIETALLSNSEKKTACILAKDAGADFVKTSTGFAGGGATADDVALMRRVVGAEMGVKASGGIRNLADARAMIEAGATRIGASSGVSIVQGVEDEGEGRY